LTKKRRSIKVTRSRERCETKVPIEKKMEWWGQRNPTPMPTLPLIEELSLRDYRLLESATTEARLPGQVGILAEALGGVNVGSCAHACEARPCGDAECRPLRERFTCRCRPGLPHPCPAEPEPQGLLVPSARPANPTSPPQRELPTPSFTGTDSYLHYDDADTMKRSVQPPSTLLHANTKRPRQPSHTLILLSNIPVTAPHGFIISMQVTSLAHRYAFVLPSTSLQVKIPVNCHFDSQFSLPLWRYSAKGRSV
jgi:hypothetical protein